MNHRPRQTAEILALGVVFLGTTLLAVVGFSMDWAPPVASVHGAGVDSVIRYLGITTGSLLVLGTVVLVVFLWRFGRDRQTEAPMIDERAERRWSIVPVIVMALIAEGGVMVKGMPVWAQVYGPPTEDALIIDVVARQFEWLVRYPGEDGVFGRTKLQLIDDATNPPGLDSADPSSADDLVYRGEIHVPAGRMVRLRLHALDVLHSFSVPAFRVKQDIVPGLLGHTQFVANLPGEYEIACAELCGLGHYMMSGFIVVHEPDDYQAWLDLQTGWFE